MNYNYELIDCVVGNTYLIRNIRVVCIVAGKAYAINNDTPLILEIQHEGAKPIFVDKDHDLSYYINGSDFVNSTDYDKSPGTFGYEWGNYNKQTLITSTTTGSGLYNTNALISMNLTPTTSGWYTIWELLSEFRSQYGKNWFVPSKDEIWLIYQNKTLLNNLSLTGNYYYWSSSESDATTAWAQYMDEGFVYNDLKYYHIYRTRLCYTV